MLRGLVVSISIVKNEVMFLNILCDTINFYFGLVNCNFGVKARHSINLACHCLFFEEWALAYADAYIHRIRAYMI